MRQVIRLGKKAALHQILSQPCKDCKPDLQAIIVLTRLEKAGKFK